MLLEALRVHKEGLKDTGGQALKAYAVRRGPHGRQSAQEARTHHVLWQAGEQALVESFCRDLFDFLFSLSTQWVQGALIQSLLLTMLS